MKTKFTIFIIFLLLISTVEAVDYPKLNEFVTDNANLISPEDEQKIIEIAKKIEKETSVEIAIVTIKSLEGLDKEQYALELFEQAGIGKEDKDNGLLILVAIEEREYRVEVGYGLEGLIPDSSKVTIGTRILEPNFKEDEFGKGIYESLIIIQDILGGEGEILSRYQSTYTTNRRGISPITYIYLIFFIISITGSLFGKKGRRHGFLFFPLIIPGGGWNGGTGGFGSSGFGGFGGGISGGGGFGGNF
ncbi:MAG: TPM domain-containing protein [Candidatus Nanoarchaeia archaeon]|jgi:uncharacterized protein|nr:TPM domain-containing protein [Candidatus Nanoarchaeia archaeon]|tara:strand:+ start:42831 stop:43571 length:741 start_codon:yes stop_codon:yes gene_type:complete